MPTVEIRIQYNYPDDLVVISEKGEVKSLKGTKQKGFFALCLVLLLAKLRCDGEDEGVILLEKNPDLGATPVCSLASGSTIKNFHEKTGANPISVTNRNVIYIPEEFPVTKVNVTIPGRTLTKDEIQTVIENIGIVEKNGESRWSAFSTDQALALGKNGWKDLNKISPNVQVVLAGRKPKTKKADEIPNDEIVQAAFPHQFDLICGLLDGNSDIRNVLADRFNVSAKGVKDDEFVRKITTLLHQRFTEGLGELNYHAGEKTLPTKDLRKLVNLQIFFCIAPDIAQQLREEKRSKAVRISNGFDSVICKILLEWIEMTPVKPDFSGEVPETGKVLIEPLVCTPQQQEKELTQLLIQQFPPELLSELQLNKDASDSDIRTRFQNKHASRKPVCIAFNQGDSMIDLILKDPELNELLVVLEMTSDASINPKQSEPRFEALVASLARDFYNAINKPNDAD